MTKTLVIGFGNTLRGDDGAGQHAAIRIAAAYPHVDCLNLTELIPELAETMSSYDRVVFVDASVGTTVLRWQILHPPLEQTSVRTHALSPQELLLLTIELYDHCPRRAELVEIPATDFGYCEQLSPLSEMMVERFVALFGETQDFGSAEDVELWMNGLTSKQALPQLLPSDFRIS